jgi:hypothetical protein
MSMDEEKRRFLVKKNFELKSDDLVKRAFRTKWKNSKTPDSKPIKYAVEAFEKLSLKLFNPNFKAKAPSEVVTKCRNDYINTEQNIKLLKNKLKSCQLNHYIFTAPKSGSGKGGLENEYLSGGKQKGMYQFLNKYPNLMEINDITNGKYKIKWNIFKDIENEKQFEKIKSELLQKYTQIMLENQIIGENYRIFIFENKVMDVVERVKPIVIGDGIHSIQKLIELRNEKQKKDGNYPTKYIHENTILKQGYQLDSIPPKNKKIVITNTINYHNGANPKRIPLEKIPKKNIHLF